MSKIYPQYSLSVIIPVYNLENHIEFCLNSLDKQTLKKDAFEVVVIDDCSTDDTYNRVCSFASNLNIKIAQLNENGGPGIARNKGISIAEGKFILFLDGDDSLVPIALERLSKLIQENNFDLITYNWTYLADLKKGSDYFPRRRDLADMPVEHKALILHYMGMNMDGSVIYTATKKSLFNEFNIYFPGGYHEDMATIFKMYYAANRIYKLDEVLYVKNNIAGSIVNTLTKKHIDGYFNAWPLILQFLKEHEPLVDEYKQQYLRGMSGHIFTMVNKNYNLNQNNFSVRITIYENILQALEKDLNLPKPYAKSFPSESDKDKITQLFFKCMLTSKTPLVDRVKKFELACCF